MAVVLLVLLTLPVGYLVAREAVRQYFFFKHRRAKLRAIRARLADPEVRKYCDAVTKNTKNVAGDPRVGYALRPGSKAHYDYAPVGGQWTATINELGLRDHRAWSTERRDKPSVVILGDSVTFGSGVNDDKTIPALLEEGLGDYDLNVHNFAVGGYSVLDSIGHYTFRNAEALTPVIVIYLFTLKSIFDYPRSNDRKTGFHIEGWPGCLSLHRRKVDRAGGKIPYLVQALKRFSEKCEANGSKFFFLPSPALIQGKTVYWGKEGNKYTEAVAFVQAARTALTHNFLDISSVFEVEDAPEIFRRNRHGEFNAYEVHFNHTGNMRVADFLCKTIREELTQREVAGKKHIGKYD